MEQTLTAQTSQSRDLAGYSLGEGIQKDIFIVGSPKSVLEQLQRKKEEPGINMLMSFMPFGVMSKDEVFSSSQLFADEVLLKVRDI